MNDDVVRLFNHIPEVCFFIKDNRGKFVQVNQALLDRLGLQDEAEIIGTTDYDRYPIQIADQLVADDRRVIETGIPLVNHVEVLLDATGKLDWFSTTKLPLRNRNGKTVGVIGIVRNHESGRTIAASFPVVDIALKRIRANPGECSVADIANSVGVSTRQLNRLFQRALGIDVQQFLIRTRIQAAAAVIRETQRSLGEIASDFGFCDQSAFTKQFRKRLGITPAAYRAKTQRSSG